MSQKSAVSQTKEVIKHAKEALQEAINNNNYEEIKKLSELIIILERSIRILQTGFSDNLESAAEDNRKIEIENILNSYTNYDITTIENNPLLKALIINDNQETSLTIANKNDLIIKNGKMEVFEKAVLDATLKPYREGKKTREGVIVCSIAQLCRFMTGNKGTPSKKQIEDCKKALLSLRNKPLNYETTIELSEILGIEESTLIKNISGIKEEESKTIKEHIIDRCDFIEKGYKINGQPAEIALIQYGNLLNKIVDTFPYYETIENNINQIMQNKDGKLVKWAYSKERVAIKSYIFLEVQSKIRANAIGRYYSEKLPYEKIFKNCDIDVTTHRQKAKNKKNDVKTIFEHLQREGIITSFKEYTKKGQRAATGIQYRIAKAELIEGE